MKFSDMNPSEKRLWVATTVAASIVSRTGQFDNDTILKDRAIEAARIGWITAELIVEKHMEDRARSLRG